MSKELPGLSPMTLKMDMIRFQDEILHDMRQMQAKLESKYNNTEELLNEKLTKFELKIKFLEKKISELSNLITEDNSMKAKLESLFQFKEEIQDTIFKRRAKFAELEKKVDNDINEINKILTKSVIYPAIIGQTAKFQSFHEFIDFVIHEINQLNNFKNKTNLDSIISLKKKVDGTLEAFKIQINNLTPKEITDQMVKDLEDKMNSNFKLYNDKIQDIRVENSNYSVNIRKKAEEMDKQISNLMLAHNYINKKIEKIQNLDSYNVLGNEIVAVNVKINKIFDILKELAAFHPEVKKNYFHEFEKKSTTKIISGVRQYIKGNLNADELSSMKKFSYEKAKTKVFDKASPVQKTTQNIVPENLFKNPSQNRKSIFLDLNPINMGEERMDFINKRFLSRKTVNLSKQPNIITHKFVEPEKYKRPALIRKNTFSFGKNDNSESSKMNNNIKKESNNNIDFFNRKMGEKTHNIIEEENEIMNFSNNSSNSNNNNKDNNKDNNNNSNDNKLTSMENEKNKSENIKNVKGVVVEKNDKKRDETPKLKNKIDISNIKNEEKIIEEDDKELNDSVNLIKKENLDNINKVNNDMKSNNKKDDEKKKISLINLNKNKDSKTLSKDKEKESKNKILTESVHKNNHARNNKISLTKEDSNNIEFSSLSNIHQKLNFQNPHESLNSNPEVKYNNNPRTTDNKTLIPINYNFKPMNPNISIVSIKKKLYKTYSNFPKINRDNNINISPNKENYTKTITEDKFNRKEPNVASAFKQPKKILLMNPDVLPLNYFDKAFKDIVKNNLNLNENQSERNNNNNNKINNVNGIKFFRKNSRNKENKDNINSADDGLNKLIKNNI